LTLKVKVIYWFSSRFYQICIIQIFSTICISESLCLKFKVVKLFMQKTIFVEVMWAKIYNNCINSTTNYEFICSVNEKALLTYHFRVEKYWLFFLLFKATTLYFYTWMSSAFLKRFFTIFGHSNCSDIFSPPATIELFSNCFNLYCDQIARQSPFLLIFVMKLLQKTGRCLANIQIFANQNWGIICLSKRCIFAQYVQ